MTNTAKFMLALMIKNHFKDAIYEYQFCPDRRFRADFYIPSLNVLVEYEGIFKGTDNGKYSGASRHTSVLGYSTDCEKYNLATVLGYRVLRYTAKNYASAFKDLQTLQQKQGLK